MHVEMRGQLDPVQYMGHECVLVWPTHPYDFGLEGDIFTHKRATGRESGYVGEMIWIEVNVVMLQIRGIQSDLTAASLEVDKDPVTLLPNDQTMQEYQRVGLVASEVGDSFMRDYVQRLRVDSGQFWLGQSTFQPSQTWLTNFFDDSGTKLRMSGTQRPTKHLVTGQPSVAITIQGQRRILEQIAGEQPLRLPESILQEARFTLWASPHADPSLATLLSAIAVESKVHQVLRHAASEPSLPFVDYVLSNPREVTVSADNLFDKFSLLVCGRSLRTENKTLFVSLKSLFQDRNKVAHRGSRVESYEVADAHVRTASAVFEWLASVAGSPTTPLSPSSEKVSTPSR